MSEKNVRVLLVAVGGYGQNYLKEMTEQETGGEIVGICDVTPDLASIYPVIAERKIPVYKTIDDFYKVNTADLAVIAAPIQFHAKMALTCMEAGSHVLCEKPLCTSAAEADQLADAARRTGKFLALGYQMDYQRDVWQFKQDIIAGRYGAPLRMRTVHAMRRGAKYYARNNWAGHIRVKDYDVYDSPFNNACAHQFQLMSFLLGNTLRSAADMKKLEGEVYHANPAVENFDAAALRYTTESGVTICYYTAHALEDKKLGPNAVYEFEHATFHFDSEHPSFYGTTDQGETVDYSKIHPGKRLQKLYDAIDCVKNGGTPACGVEAEYAHIHAVLMAQQLPVQPVNPALVENRTFEEDQFVCVRDLGKIFTACAEQYKLPAELGYQLG